MKIVDWRQIYVVDLDKGREVGHILTFAIICNKIWEHLLSLGWRTNLVALSALG